ncbi:MAG: CehA/McbA family metallohydrolase [Prolixibacteraceae bacterium]|jgi:hypothetical protein|nr:CehA/McbA family metallohydrolase [Prolixibacteraceae bacterium]
MKNIFLLFIILAINIFGLSAKHCVYISTLQDGRHTSSKGQPMASLASVDVPVLAQYPELDPELTSITPLNMHGDFYIAQNGRDSWSGTLTAPRTGGTDGPFATLDRARDAVRAARARDASPRAYTVIIRGGFYPLGETLVFKPEDSATADAPTTYAAWPGEKPVFSGGRRITGWQKSADGNTWTVVIPEVRDGKWYSTQLFVNGRRCTRARIPNEGFLRSDGPPRFSKETLQKLASRTLGKRGPITGDNVNRMGMSYQGDDLKPWANLQDVNLHVIHAWTSAMHWIDGLDEQNHSVLFTGPSRSPGNDERQMPYYIENLLEGLDSPGEWYLDRKTGLLTYWPITGEDMTSAETIVSVLQTLVRFDGTAADGKFIDGLIFRGLSFQHADWGPLNHALENDGYSGCHFLEAAVSATALRYSVFERCEITRSGGYALYLIDGSAFNRVQQCEIHGMGGGGVLIGSRWSSSDIFQHPIPPDDLQDDLLARYNVVDNCFLHDNGQIFLGVIGGVFIAHSPYNKVTHNEICNMPYSGVTIGRRLDYKYSHAHHNEVGWNHIHHIGQGVMSDMGGIYTEGVSPGTRLHHNLIHDVNCYRYGGWGLYCDQGSKGILLDHNIVYDCTESGYMQNIGSGNIIRNNIFYSDTVSGQFSVGRKRHPDAGKDLMTVERNIIASLSGEILARFWNKEDAMHFDQNIYWKSEDKELRFKDWSLDQWHGMGQDNNSIIADPLFVDAAHHDFRLKPGSPAVKIGFDPIDTKEIGLYGSASFTRNSGLTGAVVPPVAVLDGPSSIAKDVDKRYGTIEFPNNTGDPAGEISHCTFVYTAGSEGVKPGESICFRWDYWRTASSFETKPEIIAKTQNGAVLSGIAVTLIDATWPKPRYTPLSVLKVDNGEILPGEKVNITFAMRFPEVNNLEGGIYAFILTSDGKEVRLKDRISLYACNRAPEKLSCTAEARPIKGQKGRVTIAVTDKYNNPVTNFTGTVQITGSTQSDLPAFYTFKESDKGFKHFEVTFRPGVVTRITASYKSIKNISNPVLPRENTEPGIFFGDIHVHCEISSDAVGSPDRAYEHARNFCGLDFAGLADHSPRGEKYERLIAAGNRYNSPQHFATIIGFEWSTGRYGHRNAYYPDDKGPEQPDSVGDNTAPWWKFLDEHNVRALIVPHHPNMQGGLKANGTPVWGPMDWSKINNKYQRVVEIEQHRGSSEAPGGPNPELRIYGKDLGSSVQTALAMGHRLGFIGSTDTHLGRPGIGKGEEGLAAILSPELERKALFNSMYDRHCYATSGARILIFFTVNGFPMGSEVKMGPKDPRNISFRAIGTNSIKNVELLRNNEVIKTWNGTADDISGALSVKEEIGQGEWYYIRVTQTDREMAWSSPIWVDKK